jgi:hypothetical protein
MSLSAEIRAQPATALDQYSVKIGHSVSPDHRAKGAGIIQELGQRQSYSFFGWANEVVFVGLGPCEGAQPSLHLLKPDNAVLAGVIGTCNGIIGRQTLPVTGRYRIVVSTDKSNVSSRYGFSLRTVPPDHHFSVHLPLNCCSEHTDSRSGTRVGCGRTAVLRFQRQPRNHRTYRGQVQQHLPQVGVRATKVDDPSDMGFGKCTRRAW